MGTKLVQPTGDCGYDAPIVPDGVTLSTRNSGLWKCISNLKAGICYHMAFYEYGSGLYAGFWYVSGALVIMSGAWALKIIRG